MGFITGTLILLTILIFGDSYIENVRESQERCGKYAFMIDSVDKNIVNSIKKHNYVEEAFPIKCIEEKNEDKFYSNYFGDEELLDVCGIQITKGKFPQNYSEILLDEDALTYLGFGYKSIGDTIEWEINGEKKEYIISGYCKKTLFFNEISNVSEFKMVFYEEKPEANSTYFTVSKYDDLFDLVKSIQSDVDIDIYANNALLGELGFFNEASLYEQNMLIYRYIFVIFIICNIFLVINIIKVYLANEFEIIGIINLIGINKRKICAGIVGSVLLVVLCGMIFGFVNAILIHVCISKVMYNSFKWAGIVLFNIDYKILIKSLVIILASVFAALIPVMIKINAMSPNALFQGRSILIKSKVNKRKAIYKRKGNFERKTAKNKLDTDKLSKVVSIIGCCMGSLILIIGLYYLSINYSGKKGNFDNEYEINLRDIFDDKKIAEVEERIENNLGLSEDIKLRGIYYTTVDGLIKKEDLDKKYKEFLSQDVSKQLALESIEESYETYIKVYAYNDEALKEICEINGIKDWKLKEGEAYVTKNIFSVENNFASFKNSLGKGDTLTIYSGEDEDIENKYTIKNELSDLHIYSGYEDYDIIIIIPETEYKQMFESKIPDCLYIKDKIDEKDIINSNALEKIEHEKDFHIKYPSDQRKEEINLNRILKVFMLILSLMALIMAMIIILSSTLVRISVNVKEYAMMKAIGVSDKSINKMFICENMHIFIWSQVLTIFTAYFATKGLLVKKYVTTGTYLYKYPIGIVVLAMVVLGRFWSLLLIPILHKIHRIDITDELKEINS